jgi:hypothetical protein
MEHNAYPLACDNSGRVVPPDDARVSLGYVPNELTTPAAYTGVIPLDPFNEQKPGWDGTSRRRYRYATNCKTCWIMASVGPDRQEEMKIEDFCNPEKADCDPRKFFSHFGVGTAVLYDTSNGTNSKGEIVKYGP